MDEIQKVLITAGRKDLAQKYYEKVAEDVGETKFHDEAKQIYNKYLRSAFSKMVKDLIRSKTLYKDDDIVELVDRIENETIKGLIDIVRDSK